ncbi:MAG: hypothetical protein FWC68_02460, partial [Oscillospiraceae bacterium]|nr:hypothetical protein [Oscillospiraceae bacterium]
ILIILAFLGANLFLDFLNMPNVFSLGDGEEPIVAEQREPEPQLQTNKEITLTSEEKIALRDELTQYGFLRAMFFFVDQNGEFTDEEMVRIALASIPSNEANDIIEEENFDLLETLVANLFDRTVNISTLEAAFDYEALFVPIDSGLFPVMIDRLVLDETTGIYSLHIDYVSSELETMVADNPIAQDFFRHTWFHIDTYNELWENSMIHRSYEEGSIDEDKLKIDTAVAFLRGTEYNRNLITISFVLEFREIGDFRQFISLHRIER